MEFTGTNLVLKRNIYPQTGNYSFSINCSVDNTTGKYFFGLSGNGNNIEFKLESGKIFFDNKYIHSYTANRSFEISADFTNTKTNIRKDSAALIYGGDKTTGFFDYFYFKRDSISLGAEFDLNVSGDNIPSYSIQDKGYLFTSGQNAVTGYFINNSIFPIRIFNSNIESSQPYSFGKVGNYVSQLSSGVFAYSGDFTTIDFSQPIFTTFNTAYGDTTVLFTITDLRALSGFVFLQSIDDFTPDSNGILNRDVNYLNYSGGFVSTGFNTSLIFVLDYISGSGTFAGSGGAGYVATGYGNFLESGLVTGWAVTQTGNFAVTGSAWATGLIEKYFTGIGTGVASGIGYTGYATGTMSGYYQDYIYDGSGMIFVNKTFVGGGLNVAIAPIPEIVTYATGYLNINQFSVGNQLWYSPPTGITIDLINVTGIHLYGEMVNPGNEIYTGYGDTTWANSTTELFCQFSHGTGLAWFLNQHPDMGLVATCDEVENIIRFTTTFPGSLGNNCVFWSNAESAPSVPAEGANRNFIGGGNENNYYATGFLDFKNAQVGSTFYLVTPSGTGRATSISYGITAPFHSKLQFTKTSTRTATGLFTRSSSENYWELIYYGSAVAGDVLTSGNITGMRQVAWALSGFAAGLTNASTDKSFSGKLGIVHAAPYTGGFYFPLRAAISGTAGAAISIGEDTVGSAGTGFGPNAGFGYFKLSGSSDFNGTPVYPVNPYTGAFEFTLTGSGNYTKLLIESGSTFNKGFTGSWSILTGVNSSALYSLPVFANEAATRITGGGIFNPNSFVNLQINHIISGTNSDSARLTISGELVYNPLSTVLDIANT